MAILYRNWNPVGKVINDAFTAAGIPITGHKNIEFGDKQDTVEADHFPQQQGAGVSAGGDPRREHPEWRRDRD